MRTEVQIALAKLIEKEVGKTKLAPGVVVIDEVVTVRVQAEIKKGEDVEYTPTVDIPLKATLALVLEKAGFSRDNAAKILVEAMTEALDIGEKAEGAVSERLKTIDESLARVTAVTAALPKKVRSGATSVKGKIEAVVPTISYTAEPVILPLPATSAAA